MSPLPTRPSTTPAFGRARLVAKDDRERRLDDPCATARKSPIPRRSIQARSCTRAVRVGCCLASSRARSASSCGPMSRDGVFWRSRARLVASVRTAESRACGPVAAQHRERAHLARPVVGRARQVAGEAVAGERGPVDHASRRLGRRRAARRRARTPPTSPAPPPAARTAAAAASLTSAESGRLAEPDDRDPLGPNAAVGVQHRRPDPSPPRISPASTSRAIAPPRARSTAAAAPVRLAGFPTATASTSAAARSGAVVEVVIRMRASGGGKCGRPILRSRHGRQDHAPRERPSPQLVQHPRRRAHAAAAAAAPGHRASRSGRTTWRRSSRWT